jgi:hypothetical protein
VGAAVPGLKLPLANKEINFSFHIEHTPGGGFTLQPTDGTGAPIVGATQTEIQNHFAEKVVGMLGRYMMPEFSQALSGQPGSGEVSVTVTRNTSFATVTRNTSFAKDKDQIKQIANLADGIPLAPQPSRSWPVVRFLLALIIMSVLLYFYRHR